MQQYGYIDINGVRANVLVRRRKTFVSMLIAKGKGTPELHFSDEEKFLSEEPELLNKLLNGKTIHL